MKYDSHYHFWGFSHDLPYACGCSIGLLLTEQMSMRAALACGGNVPLELPC